MNKQMIIEKIHNLNLGTEDSGYPLEDYSEEQLETLYDDIKNLDCNDSEELAAAFEKLEKVQNIISKLAETTPTNGVFTVEYDETTNLHFWKVEDGKWMTCFSGEIDGLYSESDDLEADSLEEAVEKIMQAIETMKEIENEPWRDELP